MTTLHFPITTQGPWLTLEFTLGVHFVGLDKRRMIGIHHHGIVLTSVAALRFLCPRGPFLVWLLGAYEDERRGGVHKTDSPQV